MQEMQALSTTGDPPAASEVVDAAGLGCALRAADCWPADHTVRQIQLTRVWPARKGGVTFEAQVVLESRGVSRRAVVQGNQQSWVHCDEQPRSAWHGGELRGLCAGFRDPCISVCTPDRDAHLGGLAGLLDERTVGEALADTIAARRLGLDLGGAVQSIRVAAWRLQKRCMIGITSSSDAGQAGVYVKLFRRMPPDDVLQAQRTLRTWLQGTHHGVALPELLDVDGKRQMIIHQGIAGPLRVLQPVSADIAMAAQTLACLQRAPLAVERQHAAAEEVRIARRWLGLFTAWDHADRAALEERVVALEQGIADVAASSGVPVHRDFHTAQLLRGDRQLWLVDFDTLSMGDPEVDVSTGCSHVVLDLMRAGQDVPTAWIAVRDFLAQCRTAGIELEPRRMRFYLASALTRLGAIHALRGEPRGTIQTLWDTATAALDHNARILGICA